MSLGTDRTRNWGKEAQQCALALILKRGNVAYKVENRGRNLELRLAPSRNGVTLPFIEVAANLVHVRRGRWQAEHLYDGRVLATGISQRDVIRSTIQAVWH